MKCTIFAKRIALLKDELRKQRLDSLLITKDVNVSYMTGFTGHDGAAIVTSGRSFLFVDSRYIEEAEDCVKGFDIRLVKKSLYENIMEAVDESKSKNIGFESADLPYEVAGRLKGLIKKSSFVPVRGLVEELRSVKDAEEIRLIRKSLRLTKDVLARIMPSVKPGASEESIARKIEIDYIKNGAKSAFDPIVAVDADSSKPHAIPGKRKITRNSIVMIDMGGILKRYNSDITRIITTGSMKPRMKKIYDVVSTAQSKALEAIKPGARISEIDAIARRYIRSMGFGEYFGHALGHGVGLEVHEKPTVSGLNDGVLRPGMVFTVEPAVYIPKVGGIRIEDMVLVTDDGCEILSA